MIVETLKLFSRAWRVTSADLRGPFSTLLCGLVGVLLGLGFLIQGARSWMELPDAGSVVRIEGEVAEVHLDSTRYERSRRRGIVNDLLSDSVYYVRHVTFSLRNHPEAFYYSERSPHFAWLKRKLAPGTHTTLGYFPSAGSRVTPVEVTIGKSEIVTWDRSHDEAVLEAIFVIAFGVISTMASGFLMHVARLQVEELEAKGRRSQPPSQGSEAASTPPRKPLKDSESI